MFKKVVLSGLLSGAMVFSVGLGVRTEALETDEERLCREVYDGYKREEEKYREKIEKILEKKNKVIAKKKELLSNWSKAQKEFNNKVEKSELADLFDGWSIIKTEEFCNYLFGELVKRKNEKISLFDQEKKRCENKINRLWEFANKFLPSLKNIKAKDDARKLMIEERKYALVDPDAER